MPIYEYICKECEHGFEALVYGSEKAECPKCHSKKLTPQLSVFAVSAKSGASAVAIGGRMRKLRRPARAGGLRNAEYELSSFIV